MFYILYIYVSFMFWIFYVYINVLTTDENMFVPLVVTTSSDYRCFCVHSLYCSSSLLLSTKLAMSVTLFGSVYLHLLTKAITYLLTVKNL